MLIGLAPRFLRGAPGSFLHRLLVKETVISNAFKLSCVRFYHACGDLHNEQLRVEKALIFFPSFRANFLRDLSGSGVVREHFEGEESVELLGEPFVLPQI